MTFSYNHLLNALQEKRYKIRRTLFDYPFIRNANGVGERQGQKRALFVYLSEPFIMHPSNPRFHNHQNMKQSIHMVQALGEAGFIVDVFDVNSRRSPPSSKYDLIVSHRSNLVADELLADGGMKVYLATGMNHEIYNRNLLSRYRRLSARRNCVLAPSHLNEEEMPFVRASDCVAGFGNELTAGSWSSVARGPVKAFNNYGTFSDGFVERNWSSAKNNFLFYAGRLQMVRGLDLLLELFSRNPNLHLHVCSGFRHEEDFCRCYDKELFRTPNIHPIGLVSKRERRFREIVRCCGFVILPSCSDCQPGSVIEGMHSGLIPLVTRETGMDVEGVGVIFENDSDEMIEKNILLASGQDERWVKERSRKAHDLVSNRYSEAAFVERWRHIAQNIASHFTA